MAGRSSYTDADKAAVYVVLTTNEGNVKRTARETGIPENTVRNWKRQFENGKIPQVEDVEAALGDFTEQAEKTRWKALLALDTKIDSATPSALVAIIGMLTDKLDRAKGLDRLSTVEHKLTLPSPDEIRATLGALVQGAQQAQLTRGEEIVDAEFVEQPT